MSNISQKYNKCADNFIFHSNMNVSKERRKIFKLNMMRIDSCSKILYLYYVLNYEIYNESEKCKCFSVRSNPFANFNQYFQDILSCRKTKQTRYSVTLYSYGTSRCVNYFTAAINSYPKW